MAYSQSTVSDHGGYWPLTAVLKAIALGRGSEEEGGSPELPLLHVVAPITTTGIETWSSSCSRAPVGIFSYSGQMTRMVDG